MKDVCLFCTNSGVYDIHTDMVNNRIIKDVMVEFFGYEIGKYLRVEDTVCNRCLNVVSNLAWVKHRLVQMIYRCNESAVPTATATRPVPNHHNHNRPLNNGEKSPVGNDDNLMQLVGEAPYNGVVEMEIAEAVRSTENGNILRTSSRNADLEVSRVMMAHHQQTPAKKRKKRSKQKHWTHMKCGRYSRTTNVTPSGHVNRLLTLSSRASSVYTPAASSVVEEHYEIYSCTKCNRIFRNLDEQTEHRIEVHKTLALYWCTSCGTRYTNRDDLRKHNNAHRNECACFICHRVFLNERDFREHWNRHVEEAIPCPDCGKRYLGRDNLIEHQKNVHKSVEKRNRIDYELISSQTDQNQQETPYSCRIMVQEGVS